LDIGFQIALVDKRKATTKILEKRRNTTMAKAKAKTIKKGKKLGTVKPLTRFVK
jgi:hypothetical protein